MTKTTYGKIVSLLTLDNNSFTYSIDIVSSDYITVLKTVQGVSIGAACTVGELVVLTEGTGKYVIHKNKSEPGTSIVLAQVTGISDNFISVSAYADGTFDQDGNEILSTQDISNVLAEDYDSLPVLGQWITILKVKQQWYSLLTQTVSANSGVVADFFVDMFDRNNSGVLNGNWVGVLNAYVVVSGRLESVIATGVATTLTSLKKDNYIANIALTCQAPPAPASGGYINTGTFNYYEFKFGDGGLFRVILSLRTDNSPASRQAIANAATAKDNANIAAAAVRAAANDAVDAAANAAATAAYTAAYTASYDAAILAGNAAYWANYVAGNAANLAANSARAAAYAAANAAVLAANVAYNAALYAADAAYATAVANLSQSTYCNINIRKNNDIVAQISLVEVSNPQLTNFNFIISVNEGTITATVGNATFSYSDASVLRNCTTFSVAAITPTNKAQIQGIKVYRGDMDEPPYQTGYGKYVPTSDIPLVYKDKYHTPIKDADGKITGYTYNPLA